MSYESKKNNALKRGIEFTLTQHEYDILRAIGLHRESRCAYTGQHFIHKSNHKFSPTIERMDDRKGYTFDNCIVVTKYANQIKDLNVDKGTPIKESLPESDKNFARHIVHVCKQPNWKENLWNKQVKNFIETHKMKDVKLSKEESEDDYNVALEIQNFTQNYDLVLAEQYVKLGETLKQIPLDFELSFAEFKKLMLKKVDQLSGLRFEENQTKSLYFVDKTKPISSDNCLVTTKELQESLDLLSVKTKLDLKQMKKVFHKLSQ